ncbi:MAG: anti-sigma factor family protein [bacterium]
MECLEIRPRLGFYLDQSLPSDEVNEIREHLNTCPACLTVVEQMERFESLLGSIAFAEPSYDYWLEVPRKIIARIDFKRRNSWVSSLTGSIRELASLKGVQFGFIGAVATAAIVLFLVKPKISGNDSVSIQVSSTTRTESTQVTLMTPEAPPVPALESGTPTPINKELEGQLPKTVAIAVDRPILKSKSMAPVDNYEADDPGILGNTSLFSLNTVQVKHLRSQDEKSRVQTQQIYPIPFTENVPPKYKPVSTNDDDKPILRTFALDTRNVRSTKGSGVPELPNTVTNIRSNFLETLRIVRESSSLGEKKNIWLSYLGRESDVTYRMLGIYNLAFVLTKIAEDSKGLDEANEAHKFYLAHEKALRSQMGDKGFDDKLAFFQSIIEMQ